MKIKTPITIFKPQEHKQLLKYPEPEPYNKAYEAIVVMASIILCALILAIGVFR